MSGTFPTSPEPSKMSIQSLTPTLISTAHSMQRQVRSKGSQRWSFVLSYAPMSRTNWAPLFAFLMAQRGQYSTFTFVPPVIGSSSGSVSGSVTVNGAHAAGVSTVAISGLTGTLKAGDFIKFASANKIYMLTADATTSMSLEPPLGVALATGAAVTYTSVPFTCAMGADVLASTFNPANITDGVELTLVEAL
jgi:hypothetical protein